MTNTARLPRPKFSVAEQTELILNEMLLLHEFPHHEQAAEFSYLIERARQKSPALHAHAEIIFQQMIAERGEQRIEPGSGIAEVA